MSIPQWVIDRARRVEKATGWLDVCPHCLLTGWLEADPEEVDCDCGAALQSLEDRREALETIRGLKLEENMDNKDTHAGPAGTPNTARHTLGQLALLAETNLFPAARGLAIANTLREVGASPAGDLPLTPSDAYSGFCFLAVTQPTDTATVTSRRKTCNDLALMLEGNMGPDIGYNKPLADVLRAFAGHVSSSDDPRLRAIVATYTREADELSKGR